jgi:hypothetical protein
VKRKKLRRVVNKEIKMLSKTIYFIVELMDILDNTLNQVLCKEEDLAGFITNYDRERYKIVNVYGVSNMFLDNNEFIKKDDNLEQGDKKC